MDNWKDSSSTLRLLDPRPRHYVVDSNPATSSQGGATAHLATNTETLKPSQQRIRNLIDSITSLESFCRYLAAFPRYLFEGNLHQTRSKTALGGKELFPWLGTGVSFEVHSMTREQATGTSLAEDSKQLVAVKVPRAAAKAGLDTDAARKDWEVKMLGEVASELSCLVHKPIRTARTIARYTGVTWRPSYFEAAGGDVRMMPSVVMEKADLGTLENLLDVDDIGVLPDRVKVKLLAEVAMGMHVLESCGMVHSDLKASNVLIFSDTNGDSVLAKVSDFGFTLRTFGTAGQMSTMLKGGSPPWEAPEMAEGSNDGFVTFPQLARADIYSYGLLVWRVVLNGQTPFDDPRFAVRFPGFERLHQDDDSERLPIERLVTEMTQMKTEGQKFLQSVLGTVTEDDHDKEASTRFREIIDFSLRLDPDDRWPSFASIVDVFDHETTTKADEGAMNIVDPAKNFKYGEIEIPGTAMREAAISSTIRTKMDVLIIGSSLQEDTLPSRVRQSIFRDLHQAAMFDDKPEILVDLSLCFFLGFGVAPDTDQGLDFLVKAAVAGDIRAKALVRRLHKACGREESRDLPWKDWLFEAASKGSLIALEDLRRESDGLDETVCAARVVHSRQFRFGQLRGILKPDFMDTFRGWLEKPFTDMDSLRRWTKSYCSENVGLDGPGNRNPYYMPLHALALAGGDPSLVAVLTSEGAKVNERNVLGETPLLLAMRSGNMNIVSALLDQDADPTLATLFGVTPLHYTVFLEPEAVSKTIHELLDRGAEVDRSSLAVCVTDFYSEEEFFCEPTIYNGTPLLWAIYARRLDVVKELLSCGASPSTVMLGTEYRELEAVFTEFTENDVENIPIAYAGVNADAGIIQALLDDPSAKDLCPDEPLRGICGTTAVLSRDDFVFMCLHGEDYKHNIAETMKLLFPKESTSKLALDAASQNCVAFLDHLVAQGVDINEENEVFGLTPLQVACIRDVAGVTALRLLELGADPLKESSKVKTSCITSLATNRLGPLTLRIVQQMVQRGCTYEESPWSFTMLYWKSIRENDRELEQYLLKQEGASRKSLEEDTPMGSLLSSLIVDNTQACIAPIEVLVQRDPRPSPVIDKDGNTVWHCLAKISEFVRNDALSERLARFFMNKYDPSDELLNHVNINSTTPLGMAIITGHHRLMHLLLIKGASPSASRFPFTWALLDRIEEELKLEQGRGFLAELKWKQKLSKHHRNTLRCICVALRHVPCPSELKHLARQDGVACEELVSHAVRKWRQPEFMTNISALALPLVLDEHTVIEKTGKSYSVVEPDGTRRGVSFEEAKKACEVVWDWFLAELNFRVSEGRNAEQWVPPI